jgi:membrane fusion protein (multidrug efflux system)
VGQVVQAGQPLLAIVPLHAVWVVANFKETQLARVRPGQPATITVDGLPGLTFRGVVESISAGTGSRFSLLPPENASGNWVKIVQRVPVKIVLDGADVGNPQPLRAGMSAHVTVRVSSEGASTAPSDVSSGQRSDQEAVADGRVRHRAGDQAVRGCPAPAGRGPLPT